MSKVKGIIFDMDNTLLRSRIDFEAMKRDIFQFFTSAGVLSSELILSNHTPSTLIAEAVRTNKMTDKLMQDMWKLVREREIVGMQDAELEPGVVSLLQELQGKYCLVIVTNNSVGAAERALQDNEIMDYFDFVVGREMMGSLKPAADGYVYVLHKYKDISKDEWLSIGDAWVDGKASAEAGVQFILYQGDVEKVARMGVVPSARIMDIGELRQFL